MYHQTDHEHSEENDVDDDLQYPEQAREGLAGADSLSRYQTEHIPMATESIAVLG